MHACMHVQACGYFDRTKLRMACFLANLVLACAVSGPHDMHCIVSLGIQTYLGIQTWTSVACICHSRQIVPTDQPLMSF